MAEYLTSLVALAQIVAGLGLATAILAGLRQRIECRRWETLRKDVRDWIDGMLDAEDFRAHDFDEADWKAACESLLAEVKFPPLEIQQVLDRAVIMAKGIASDRFMI